MFVRLRSPPFLRSICPPRRIKNNEILLARYCSDITTNENLLFSGVNTIVAPSPLKIKSALKSKNVEFVDGFTCIQTSCPVCPPDKNQPHENKNIDKKCLFINKTTGDVVCSKCQYIFSYGAVEKFFTNDKRSKDDLERDQNIFIKSKPNTEPLLSIVEVDENVVPINNLNTTELEEILSHLGINNITKEAFIGTDVLCHTKRRILYSPMQGTDSETIGYKILSKNGETAESTIPETNSFGVVKFSPIVKRGTKDQKTAILVLNILDALALRMENMTNVTIICLPHGYQTLPQECLPALEPYQKLILWFDYNTVGWDIAKIFARKLDEKRCHFIRPTDDNPTPYIALKRSNSIKTILLSAQPILHKAVTTFRALRQDVLSDLQNLDKVEGIKWKRYPVLNKYLKGHRRGELTVLTGPTGCGKTTFMAEYSLDLTLQGVNTLWGSFEIRNTLLARTLLQQLAGKPLDENLEEFDKYANHFEQLPMYFMTFYGQQALKVVMEAIEHSQYVHDIHHVIIDNLQFMMGQSDPRVFDRYWKQDEIISAFRTFATRRNCHVTLVIHPRKERSEEDLTINSIFGSAKATQEADNVLIIQDKRLLSIKGKKYLQIAKNRHSGDLGIMMLEFDRGSMSYSQKSKPIKITKKTDKK